MINQKTIIDFYNKYIEFYANRDVKIIKLFSNNVTIMTGGGENYINKLFDLAEEYKKDFTQAPKPISIITKEISIQKLSSEIWIINSVSDWAIPIFEEKHEVKVRIVFIVSKIENEFKINHITLSVPYNALKEKEYFPLKEYEERNRILQEKVDEKTQEIVLKNQVEIQLIEEKLNLELKNQEQLLQISEMRTKHLEQLLDSKQRELTAFALYLVEREEFLNSIEQGLKKLIKLTQGESYKIASSLLDQVLNKSENLDSAWKLFNIHFLGMQMEFTEIMNKKFPNLSQQEIKVCILLKMQMSNKDISNLLKITVRSVENQVYRLRKKFNLDGNTKLQTYLLNI